MRVWLGLCVLAACGGGDNGGSKRPDTAQCFDSTQCESGYCAYSSSALTLPACGTCQPAGVADGGACGSAMPCVQGDACVGSTCVAEAGAGQSCDATNAIAPHCGPLLRCDTTSHTCVANTNCGSIPPDNQFVECPPMQVCVRTEGGNFCMSPPATGSASC